MSEEASIGRVYATNMRMIANLATTSPSRTVRNAIEHANDQSRGGRVVDGPQWAQPCMALRARGRLHSHGGHSLA